MRYFVLTLAVLLGIALSACTEKSKAQQPALQDGGGSDGVSSDGTEGPEEDEEDADDEDDGGDPTLTVSGTLPAGSGIAKVLAITGDGSYQEAAVTDGAFAVGVALGQPAGVVFLDSGGAVSGYPSYASTSGRAYFTIGAYVAGKLAASPDGAWLLGYDFDYAPAIVTSDDTLSYDVGKNGSWTFVDDERVLIADRDATYMIGRYRDGSFVPSRVFVDAAPDGSVGGSVNGVAYLPVESTQTVKIYQFE